MAKVLIIGAGGVGNVVAKKCAMHSDVFDEIVLASRTLSKCDKIASEILDKKIETDVVDADYSDNVVELINKHNPFMILVI